MSKSLNLATLASDLQDYYREFHQELHSELQLGLIEPGSKHNIGDRFTVIPMLEDELVLGSVIADDFIHQHATDSTETFNPLDDALEPQSRILKLRPYEGDLAFTDNEIQTSALMHMAEVARLAKATPGNGDTTRSLVEYLFHEVLMKKGKSTLRKAILQAEFDNTEPHAWSKILDGLQTLIAAEITASNITAVSMTSPTTSNVITLVESVFDVLGDAVKHAPDLVCQLSPNMYKLWTRANRGTLGRADRYDSASTYTIDGYSNCIVVEEPYLQGNRVLITPKSNLFLGVKTTEGIGNWEFQRYNRETKVLIDGKIGVQFRSVNADSSNKNVAYGA